MSYNYLFDIALILLSTKLLGLLTRRIHLPQVVGALLAGLLLGPAVLNILHETDFIKDVSELGVIILMFTAGLETNIGELKKAGKAAFIIAMCGVLLPLAGGFIVAMMYNKGDLVEPGASVVLQNIFIGVILTATSVSISVETLKELGKLSTRAGNAILGAALIDDVLGIIALTVVTSFAGESVNIFKVLLLILLFFVFAGVAGYLFYKLFSAWVNRYENDLRRFVIAAFVVCLLFSYVAERFFGVADITGAFLAGLILSSTRCRNYIASKFETLSYILLSPIFFASIGISVELPEMSGAIVMFSVLLLVVAIITKILGCGIGAKICRYKNEECVQIGVGMISRGEVALIVANKGALMGVLSAAFYGPIVIMVVITTIVTPVLLKMVFKTSKEAPYADLVQSDLVEKYEEYEQLDLASQQIARMHEDMQDKPQDKQ